MWWCVPISKATRKGKKKNSVEKKPKESRGANSQNKTQHSIAPVPFGCRAQNIVEHVRGIVIVAAGCVRFRMFFLFFIYEAHKFNVSFVRSVGHFNKSSSLRVRDAYAPFWLSQFLFIIFTVYVLRFTVSTGFSHQPCDKDLKCDDFCLVLRKLQHFLQLAVACSHTLHLSSISLAVRVRFPGVEKSKHIFESSNMM